MTNVLYELKASDGTLFSPFCWRARLALIHLDIEFESTAVEFTGIPTILDESYAKVPVLETSSGAISDSFEIACYLSETAMHGARLQMAPSQRANARFVEAWINRLNVRILPMIALDIEERLTREDQSYFRRTREARFGASLEDLKGQRTLELAAVRSEFDPMRAALGASPYMSGDQPAYPDIIVFGTFQWVRLMSDLDLTDEGDVIQDWVHRMDEYYSLA